MTHTYTSVYEFDLRRDDEVSYCNTSGNHLSGVLTNITAHSGVVPIHAEVKLANAVIRKVKYSAPRPGTPRSQLIVTDDRCDRVPECRKVGAVSN